MPFPPAADRDDDGAGEAAWPPEGHDRRRDTRSRRRERSGSYGRSGGRRRRGAVLALSGVAAASVAAAITLGVITVRTQQRADEIQAANRELSQVLAAPDARAVKRQVTGGGTGMVVVSRRQGKAVVVMAGLSDLPRSKSYELWLLGAGAPKPAGLMRPAGADQVQRPVTVTALGRNTQVGITVEPAAGSRSPTSQPIFVAPLPG